MSIRDAARASGLSPKALRRRIERGTLRSVMVGGRRRIPVDDLVRRGLVPDGRDPAADEVPTELHDPITMARRLRALESRVAALESALAGAGPTEPSAPRLEARLVVADPHVAMGAAAASGPSSPH